MYIKKLFECGQNILEIEKIFTHKFKAKSCAREFPKNKTTLAQEKVNARNASNKFRRLVHANFGYGDSHIVLTYDKFHKTADLDLARKDIQKFLRRLRNIYKKRELELKYVSITEYGKKGKSIHHHLIINSKGVEPGIIGNCWDNGGVSINPLDNTGNYEQLTSYLIKQTADIYNNEELGVFHKRWNASKNLVTPQAQVQIVKADSWREDPVIPHGYMMIPDSLTVGVSEVTGYPFQYYRLMRIPGIKISPKKIKMKKRGVKAIGSSRRKNHSKS